MSKTSFISSIDCKLVRLECKYGGDTLEEHPIYTKICDIITDIENDDFPYNDNVASMISALVDTLTEELEREENANA